MQTQEFIHSYFDAWNHHDPKGIADHLAPGGIYNDVPEHAVRSRAQLVGRLREFFNQHWHRYELVGNIVERDDTIAFQYRFVPVEGRARGVPATYRGAEFVTWDGDRAVAITDYYDLPVCAKAGRYAKSGLSSEQLQRNTQRLHRIMQRRQAYLQPDLSLPKLAQLVGCSVNHLSQVINQGFGTTFFDYLNRYRIAHARELLKQPECRDAPILDIAFSAGFNSNSTFYSAFKKRVGVSPARYRLDHLTRRN